MAIAAIPADLFGRATRPTPVRLTRRGRMLRNAVVAAAVGVGAVSVLDGFGVLARESVPIATAAGLVASPAEVLEIVVDDGDSLWAIARRVAPKTDPREVVMRLREENGLPSNLIQPGQVLLFHPSGQAAGSGS